MLEITCPKFSGHVGKNFCGAMLSNSQKETHPNL